MAPAYKPERVPANASSEPSEPSQLRPEDKPRTQLAGVQEENPQVVAHEKGRQACDSSKELERKGRGIGAVGNGYGQGARGEKMEGDEGVLDKSARDGFAGGGKLDRKTVKSKL